MRGLVLGVLGYSSWFLVLVGPRRPSVSHLRMSQVVFPDEDCLILLFSSAGSADNM